MTTYTDRTDDMILLMVNLDNIYFQLCRGAYKIYFVDQGLNLGHSS